MRHRFHAELLQQVETHSGKPATNTFLNSYLGSDHIRYPISTPALRTIAKDWMRAHKNMSAAEFMKLITSLIEGPSATEKQLAGIMLSYANREQRKFNPVIFDQWLDHLVGWAEVDAVCTGDFTVTQLPSDWTAWKRLLTKLSRDKNIHKRRASLVLLCSPLSRIKDDGMASTALQNIDGLKSEKEILITKAISWLLRSMIKHYREMVSDYLQDNIDALPKIAVRETLVKLKTGKKTRTRLEKE